MKKVYWQIVHKEWGRIDGEFNKECSRDLYETKEKAWEAAMLDCETDEDIAYLLNMVSSGIVNLKEVLVPENISSHVSATEADEDDIMWQIFICGDLIEDNLIFKTHTDALQWASKTFKGEAVDMLNEERLVIEPVHIYKEDEDDDDDD